MEERSVFIPVSLEEADAIVSHAVTSWRWGARRLLKELGDGQIAGHYELNDSGNRYVLDTRVEKQEDGALVSWYYPGRGEELMMASPQLIDFLQTGIAKALRPYQMAKKSGVFGFHK